MSLVAVSLTVWRILLNVNAASNMAVLLPAVQKRLEKDGVRETIKFCAAEPGLIPRKLFVAGLENHKHGLAAMRRAMANRIELDILPELNFLLAPILAIAKIATMVGLLGTVVAMINTFTAIQKTAEAGGGANVATSSGAIGLALFATALGLMIAIPLVFAHVLFKDWVVRFETKMKTAALKLTDLVQAIKPVEGKAASAAPKPPAEAAPIPVAGAPKGR
jgi:biopolymer transport protein ExbB